MLFLLPPSESKVVGGSGPSVSRAALSFGGLNPARQLVADALIAICNTPEVAAKVLKVGAKQLGDIDANRNHQDAPTLRALERYSGTLYDAIHRGAAGTAQPLDADAWNRANEVLFIQSSLFGLVSATDPIPYYRFSSTTRLSGLRLTDVWPAAHEPIFRRLSQGLIVDLRSKAYAELAPIPADIPSVWVEVVSRESDGTLRALNHFNKQAKGLLVRAILTADALPETVADLTAIAAGIGMELRQDQSGDQLTLITAQVKKGDLPR